MSGVQIVHDILIVQPAVDHEPLRFGRRSAATLHDLTWTHDTLYVYVDSATDGISLNIDEVAAVTRELTSALEEVDERLRVLDPL